MKGREKLEAALSKEGTFEIPAVIIYENVTFRDLVSQFTSCPWWYKEDPLLGH